MTAIPRVPGFSRGSYADQLIPHLTRGQRAQFLKKVLNTPGVESQIEACLTLWRYLPKEARQQALNLALQVRDRPARAKYLAQIAQKLRTKAAYPELIQHVAKTILEIRNEDHRRTALSDVRSYVQDEAIEQAAKLPAKRLTPGLERLPGYRFAFAQRDPQYIAYALGNLSASMSDEPRIQAQSLMVDLALEIDLHDYVAEAIEGIAPYLDEPHLGEALEGALRIGNGWSRVWALSGLAPYLTGERLTICLSDALAATGLLDEKDDHSDSWYIVDMAARLLPSLKGRVRERVLSKGLAAAQTSAEDFYDSRIRFLAYLDSAAQSELAEAVLRDVARLPDEAAQAHTLSGLAPYLSAHLVALALQRPM
jgi:hypothetical protein